MLWRFPWQFGGNSPKSVLESGNLVATKIQEKVATNSTLRLEIVEESGKTRKKLQAPAGSPLRPELTTQVLCF